MQPHYHECDIEITKLTVVTLSCYGFYNIVVPVVILFTEFTLTTVVLMEIPTTLMTAVTVVSAVALVKAVIVVSEVFATRSSQQ